MKALKEYNLKELSLKIYDLVSITSVEIGHKTDGNTMAALSKIFGLFAKFLVKSYTSGAILARETASVGIEVPVILEYSSKSRGETGIFYNFIDL